MGEPLPPGAGASGGRSRRGPILAFPGLRRLAAGAGWPRGRGVGRQRAARHQLTLSWCCDQPRRPERRPSRGGPGARRRVRQRKGLGSDRGRVPGHVDQSGGNSGNSTPRSREGHPLVSAAASITPGAGARVPPGRKPPCSPGLACAASNAPEEEREGPLRQGEQRERAAPRAAPRGASPGSQACFCWLLKSALAH